MNAGKKYGEVWELLNETALFLSRTAVEGRYADRMAVLREWLHNDPLNPAILSGTHDALAELRKELRLAGYDFSMGKYKLVFDGFRTDEAWGVFTRVVLFIDQKGLFYWISGDDNHRILTTLLERQMIKKTGYQIEEQHYLWFARNKTTVTLSGSATEQPEDYKKLKARGEADSILFLSRLKGLC